jgi:hypothetical protein
MKDMGALVNSKSKKISAKKRRKNVQSLEHLIAGFGPGSTSGPVVDLEGEDPSEQLERESAKKQKMGTPSKEQTTSIRAVPVRSERGDFLQLPKAWSEPELCGPQSTLFLDDPELKIIQDLGPAGWSKAITDGVIATMKALEVAVALNNASLKGEIWVDALAQERDALTAKVAALEEEARIVDRIGELEGSLLYAVKLGFDRAVAQLMVVNPDIDLIVEGIHHLSDVKDGVIEPPPDLEEDGGHVDNTQANEAL